MRDVTYLLEAANHYFPDAHLTERDVVSTWAGIRPLAAHGATGAPSSASREHSIVESTPGLVRVTGGKLTTYRSMAEEIVDLVERLLGRSPTPSRTAKLPLAGGDLSRCAGGDRARGRGDGRRDDRAAAGAGVRHRMAWRVVADAGRPRARPRRWSRVSPISTPSCCTP